MQPAPAADAERIADAVRAQRSLDPIYAQLDRAITDLTAAGHRPEDLLPADAEPGIGFSLREKRDGKSLWQAIGLAARGRLCDPNGDVRTRLDEAAKLGAGSAIALVMATLGLPPIAVPVAVAIVGLLLAVGVDGFCDWLSGAPDEPAAA